MAGLSRQPLPLVSTISRSPSRNCSSSGGPQNLRPAPDQHNGKLLAVQPNVEPAGAGTIRLLPVLTTGGRAGSPDT